MDVGEREEVRWEKEVEVSVPYGECLSCTRMCAGGISCCMATMPMRYVSIVFWGTYLYCSEEGRAQKLGKRDQAQFYEIER